MNDYIIFPVIDNLLYLKLEFSNEIKQILKQSLDQFNDIIAGIGLSSLNKNKSSHCHSNNNNNNSNQRRNNSLLRNCILFSCQTSDMINVFKNTFFVPIFNKKLWKQFCQNLDS